MLRPYQVEGYRWLNLLRSYGIRAGSRLTTWAWAPSRSWPPSSAWSRSVRPAGRPQPSSRTPQQPDRTSTPRCWWWPLPAWSAPAGRRPASPGLRVVAARRTSARRGVAVSEVGRGGRGGHELHDRADGGGELRRPALSWVVLDEAQLVKNWPHLGHLQGGAVAREHPRRWGSRARPWRTPLMDLWSLLSATAQGCRDRSVYGPLPASC